jgi:hypothetical protein
MIFNGHISFTPPANATATAHYEFLNITSIDGISARVTPYERVTLERIELSFLPPATGAVAIIAAIVPSTYDPANPTGAATAIPITFRDANVLEASDANVVYGVTIPLPRPTLVPGLPKGVSPELLGFENYRHPPRLLIYASALATTTGSINIRVTLTASASGEGYIRV